MSNRTNFSEPYGLPENNTVMAGTALGPMIKARMGVPPSFKMNKLVKQNTDTAPSYLDLGQEIYFNPAEKLELLINSLAEHRESRLAELDKKSPFYKTFVDALDVRVQISPAQFLFVGALDNEAAQKGVTDYVETYLKTIAERNSVKVTEFIIVYWYMITRQGQFIQLHIQHLQHPIIDTYKLTFDLIPEPVIIQQSDNETVTRLRTEVKQLEDKVEELELMVRALEDDKSTAKDYVESAESTLDTLETEVQQFLQAMTSRMQLVLSELKSASCYLELK